MAYPWTSAYLLTVFNRYTGRPKADSVTVPSKYERLTEAQSSIVADIAAICPWVLYPTVTYANMPTMTTSDNQIFTFGTNATTGFPIAPMGRTGIYSSLAAIPDCPWVEGVDYLNEGTQIRIPNNGTYSGTLYWRGITPPGPISDDADEQPSLYPEGSRELIPLRAAEMFLLEGGRNPQLAAVYHAQYVNRWARWCLEWRTAFKGGGVLGHVTGMQVAIGSYNNFPFAS